MGTRPRRTDFEDEPGRSIPLSFDLFCPEQLRPLTSWIAHQALSRRPIRIRPKSLLKAREAADVILANLINARKISRRCFVGISRDANAYTLDARYCTRVIGWTAIIAVLDWFEATEPGLVNFIPGFYDRRTRCARDARSGMSLLHFTTSTF
jgi:hypothetical protein